MVARSVRCRSALVRRPPSAAEGDRRAVPPDPVATCCSSERPPTRWRAGCHPATTDLLHAALICLRIERHTDRPGPLVEQLGLSAIDNDGVSRGKHGVRPLTAHRTQRTWSPPGADSSSAGDGGPGFFLTSTQRAHRSVSLKAGNGEPFMSQPR